MDMFFMGGGGVSRARVNQILEDYAKITTNYCNTPGGIGFPNGVCPTANLPAGMIPLPGFATLGDNNYGNYQFRDGSQMVYRPRTWCIEGDGTNGFGVNVKDVKPWNYFDTAADAAAAGYWVHDVFLDGGGVKLGIFCDKFMCSKNALGTGSVASSIENGLPLSTSASHNPIADLTACAGNSYHEAINAAHARDGVDGAANVASIFFVESKQLFSYLAFCSMAHGQASTAITYNAWYDAAGVTNFPKGCNDNALGDVDDAEILYTTDGYSNCGLTGSGTPFAKTTDNGQACGVADLNGLLYEISIGLTCIATTGTITAATQDNPCQLTVVGHGKSTGDYIQIASVVGMTEINSKIFTLTVVDVDNITLDGVDSSAFAAYTSGGSATFGKFYRKKDSVSMKDFTSGNSAITDHWGAAGVAAMMDEYDMVLETAYPSNGFAQRMGSGANQVLSPDLAGNGAVLRSLGIPQDADGVDATGTNLFGKDYFYQYIRNELCVRSGGYWAYTSNAGVWYSSWSYGRTNWNADVGFRCACHPV